MENSKCPNTAETTGKKIVDQRLEKFLSMLECLPRLCSPTICGTLSMNATKNSTAGQTKSNRQMADQNDKEASQLEMTCEEESNSIIEMSVDNNHTPVRLADNQFSHTEQSDDIDESECQQNKTFEWSIEQAATLFPTNITVDNLTDNCYDVADLDLTWRTKENEEFFSQKTIAPSPCLENGINSVHGETPSRYKSSLYNTSSDGTSDPSDPSSSYKTTPTSTKSSSQTYVSTFTAYISAINDDDSLQSVNDKLANNHVDDSDTNSRIFADQQEEDYDVVDGIGGYDTSGQEVECDNQLIFSPSEAPKRGHDLRLTISSPGTFNSLFEQESKIQHSTPKTTSQNVAASKRIKPRRRICL